MAVNQYAACSSVQVEGGERNEKKCCGSGLSSTSGAHPTPPPVSPTVLTPLSIHGMVDEYLTFTPFRLLNSKKFPPLLTGLCLTLFTKMKKSVRGEGQGRAERGRGEAG